MKIKICDEIDLKKIQKSGQCFRVAEISEGLFRFITGTEVVYIRKLSEDTLDISCTKEKWESIWEPYFDFDRNYGDICKEEYGKHSFSDSAMDFGRGLRILKQDKWEMLITFIISQRKSIPAIATAVEGLCEKFGEKIDTEYETIYSFPEAKELLKATPDDLKACGLGYRAPYVRDAVEKVCSGELNLESLDKFSDDELFEELMKVHGVGKKVANCVCLFGYGRTERVPIDVWISRAIDEEFGGENLFPMYGKNGGIIQQYIFYYEKNSKLKATSGSKYPYPCPCCGEGVIEESHDICKVCGWENDKLQEKDPDMAGGANKLSLNEFRKGFLKKVKKSGGALILLMFLMGSLSACGSKGAEDVMVSTSPSEAISNANKEMENADALLQEIREKEKQEDSKKAVSAQKSSGIETEENVRGTQSPKEEPKEEANVSESSSTDSDKDADSASSAGATVKVSTDGAGYGVYIGANASQLHKKLDNNISIGFAIIDAQNVTSEDVRNLKSGGRRIYSYLNVGSIENFRSYYENYKDITLGAYENWDGEFWVDVSKPEWASFICETLAPELIAKGVDGFFIDNCDVYYQYQNDEIYKGLSDIISKLSTLTKGSLIINGGDVFVSKLMEDSKISLIEGVNQESVFSKIIDYNNNIFAPQDEENKKYYLDYLKKVNDAGKEVYLIEYTQDEAVIEEIQKTCSETGYRCYVTNNLQLNGGV